MSTLRLILTRHAKSSWDDTSLTDHSRPLNGRGRRSAGVIGGWLASRGVLPQQVLCSDANRTRETWERLEPSLSLPEPAVVSYLPELYHAAPEQMLAVLQGAEASVVMMIGHNPGISAFARRILARQPVDPEFHRYPTGATMIATFDRASWADVDFGTGAMQDYVAPRMLEG